MKQETGKKSKLWLWIVLAVVALLAVAGVAVAMLGLFGPSEAPSTEPTETKPVSEVYWNVDRVQFTQDSETGLSTREKGEDGLYHFRFASQGKLMEIATADKQLVNFIDTMDACGLQLDADGLIIDVYDVKDIAVETAKSFYVKNINGNTVTVNSSIAMNGMDITFEMSDSTYVMDVRQGTETLGEVVGIDVMDVVCVYGSEENPAESVFLMERPESSPLYLRIDRFYNSAEASTTRVPDENGVYTIPFSLAGEILQLKCKDKNIVTAIDVGTDAKQVMGLTFDEEGYITGTITAATAARAKLACQVYHVTAMNGTAVEATRKMTGSEQGKVVNFNLTEETVIIMGEDGCCHFIGERVPDLQMNDRIICWTDMNNNALYIYIARRQVHDIPMYYNFEKKSVDAEKVTTRLPNESGYYVFNLASKGKVVTVKTKDKALASKIDADSYQFFGLKVEKGIVKEYYNKDCLTGGYGIGGTTRYVTQVMATIVQISGSSKFDSFANYILTPNTEIYDMTQDPGTKVGSKTTLQLGDRIIAARDVENNMTHVYVLDRYYKGCKIYYNESRKYSSTTLETTRVPLADGEYAGYYEYVMYCEGKKVKVYTKDKAIATAIDLQNVPIVAMKVSNNIVKAAYPAISAVMYGAKKFNNNYVGEITADKTVSCYYFSNGERKEASASYKMASNCQIYNVSTNYNKSRGEKATLKVGDKIQAILNYQTGELTHIWILSRAINAPLYLHTNRVAPTNGITNRVPDADGYYSVDLFVDGKIKTFRTKDAELMGRVDTYGSETFFTMQVKGDIIQKVDAASASIHAVNTIVSHQDVMKISGKTITTQRKRPGQSNTGATKEFTYSSKTKIYNVSYYAGEARWKEAKLKKGDRIIAYGDKEGNISYIFIMYPGMHEKGYESKCPHCNKTVWWEPWTGSAITTAGDQIVHYYQPADYERSNQGTIGKNVNSDNSIPRFTAVFDMNGKTLTTTGGRNFLVYYDLIIVDTVGGGVLESNGYQGGAGGNFMVSGGTVTINNGVTLRQNDSPDALASNGGNFVVSNLEVKETGKTLVGKVTLNDAKLEAWDCVDGGNIKLNAGTELTIKKATITGGDIQVAADAKVKLNGSNIKIEGEGINLTSGAKIAESKLSGSSKVTIQANGIFTEKLSNANEQKAFYVSEFKYYPIEVRDSALWTDRDPSKPDYVKEPEIPALPEVMKVDNTALTLDANKQAKCPVCNEVVTWTALTDNTASHVLANGHYYLPADINYEAADMPYIQIKSGGVACLHLNDKNLIATNAQVAHVNGTLSIMGNGTVSGNGFANYELISTKRPDLHAATIEANGSKAVVNLYGGTYVKSAENDARIAPVYKSEKVQEVNCANYIVEVHGNGGTINMFEGAVIDGRNVTKKGTVVSYWGMFNLYGGTVYGGTTTAVQAGNWTDSKSGGVSIYGGTVQAGSGAAVSAGGVTNGPATLNIYGGQINGNTTYDSETKLVLAGNPVLTKLTQPSTKIAPYYGLITLGKLTEGAYIPITGSEAISFQNENAADYVKYFISLTDTEIVHQNFAVSFYYVPDPELPEVPAVMPAVTEDLQFIGETNWALCPLCKEYVKWTPVTQKMYGAAQINGGSTLPAGAHYYLAEDITYTGTAVFMNAPGGSNENIACFHLNGHNFTGTNANFAHGSYGHLNILGTGIVAGNGKNGATITINTNKDFGAGIYLHSGTYTKVAGNEAGVVQVNSNGGRIWVGPDATIKTSIGQLAAKVAGGNFEINGTLAIEGTVEGGYVQSVEALTKGGAVILELKNADLQGGAKIAKDTKFGLIGNTKVEKLDMTSGAQIIHSELSGDAKVTVKANGIFTAALENVEAQKAFYAPIVGYRAVEIKDGALWTEDDPDVAEEEEIVFPDVPAKPVTPAITKVDNSDLVLDAENKAKCPVCGEVVVWTAITEVSTESHGYEFVGDGHYYLANDITYDVDGGTAMGIWYNSEYKGMPACLHLNGHNITATKGIAIFGGMELNIMGNGIVSGNRNSASQGSALQLNSGGAIVNVYGGTYTKNTDNGNSPVVNIGAAGNTLNIFDSVVIDSRGAKGNTVQATWGTLNIFGGEIYGGNSGYCVYATYSSEKCATINIMGGKVIAGSYSTLGASGSATVKPSMNVYGGEILGGAAVSVNAKFSVSGNPIMTRLVVNKNAKLIVGELTEGASIAVLAEGVFTEPCMDAAQIVEKGYIAPFKGYDPITVEKYAMSTVKTGSTVEPEDPKPEDPQPEPEKVIDNSNLTFTDGNKAKCPVCEKEVEWTAITQATHGTAGIGEIKDADMHYYLAEDLTYTGETLFVQAPGTAKTACFHLNGHNITSETQRVFFGFAGVLNIVGNGNVSSGYNKANEGATIAINTSGKGGAVNIYGGTYTKAASAVDSSVIAIHSNGGKIYLAKDVKVVAVDAQPAVLFGKAALRSSELIVEGATIEGLIKTVSPAANTESKSVTDTAGISKIELTDAKVDSVSLAKGVSFTVAGDTVIKKLDVAAEALITLGELTENASITVKANGVFSEPSDSASKYARNNYFVPVEGYKSITVVNNALFTEEGVDAGEYVPAAKPVATVGGQNVSDEVWANVVKAGEIQYKANKFSLDADNKAECPVCGEVVEWVEATYPGQKTDENGKYHFYIDADTEVKKNYNWATLNGKNMSMCIMLLNEDTVKDIGGLMGVRGSSNGCTYNIMGYGVLTTDGTKTSDGNFGLISVQGTNNTINLYGGTYLSTESCVDAEGVPNSATINVRGKGGHVINMYDGVVIGPATQDLTKEYYNVRIASQAADVALTFNMYGGVIRNGVTNNAKTGGNVHLHYDSKYTGTKPTFNMYGGLISNGSYVQGDGIESVTANGGNIYAGAGSQLSIYGGLISGGKVNGTGGNIVAIDSSVSKISINGGTIKDGQAKNGGNIYATAAVEINAFALIEGGHATANGGNIYITGNKKTVTQASGSEIRNGTCGGNGGGNVFVNAGAIYNMNGGKIYDGKNTSTSGKDENAGNVLIQGLRKELDKEAQTEEFTDAYFNMAGDAEIYGGIAPNQGGNIRVYIGTFTMTDNAKVHGGDGQDKDGSVDDIWLVDGNLVMSGNAAVVASETSGASVSVAPYRRNNTITLSGNASITGGAKPLSVSKGSHANYKTPIYNTLQIANDWTGTATVDFTTAYKVDETIDALDGICGTITDGVLTAGGSFTGKLYSLDAAGALIQGVDGKLTVVAGEPVPEETKVEETNALVAFLRNLVSF